MKKSDKEIDPSKLKVKTALQIQAEIQQVLQEAPEYLREDKELLEVLLKTRIKHYQVTSKSSFVPKMTQNIDTTLRLHKKYIIFDSIDTAFDYLIQHVYGSLIIKPKRWKDAYYSYHNNRPLTAAKKLEVLEDSGGFKLKIFYRNRKELTQFEKQEQEISQKIEEDMCMLFAHAPDTLKEDKMLQEMVLAQRIKHYRVRRGAIKQLFSFLNQALSGYYKKPGVVFTDIDKACQHLINHKLTVEKIKPSNDPNYLIFYDFMHQHKRNIGFERKLKILLDSKLYEIRMYYKEKDLIVF